MKNKVKNCLIIMIGILLLGSLFPSKIYAAASASISASKTTINAGESTTISINVVNTETWEVKLSASGGTLSTSEGTHAFGEEKTTTALTSNFTANTAGTYTISFSGTVADSSLTNIIPVSGSVKINVKAAETPSTGNSGSGSTSNGGSGSNTGSNSNSSGNTGSGSGSTDTRYPSETKPQTTKTEQSKSSNNYLSGITLGTGTLSPEFYRETYEYTVEFDDTVNLYDLKEIEISATAEDSRATVKGAGTIQLNEGENNIALTVTAENGSERTYTVKVVKPAAIDQSALRLQTLVLNGINSNGEYQTINLDFDPETFDYNVTVPNEITSLSINPTTENDDIIIETTGGDNLNEGDNRIVIMLTSPSDETIKTTYTINVNREAALVQEAAGLTKEQIGIIVIASVVGVILLIAIVVAIVKHARRKKGFEYDDDDDDNNMNFIENEEGEDIVDTDEVENPYPDKIVTSEVSEEENKDKIDDEEIDKTSLNKAEDTEQSKENVENDDAKDNEENDELKFKNTYNEENIDDGSSNTKSKWDDFVKGYDDEEDEPKPKKKKHGKRFL